MPAVSSSKALLGSVFIAIAVLANPIRTGAQVPSQVGDFKFFMSAVAKVSTGGHSRVVPLSDEMVLATGNRIKFFAELQQDGYLYLFHEDSSGALALLFPGEPDSAKVAANTPLYVPGGAGWIELDSNPGKETFHLLVSAARLVRLENLCATHRSLEGTAAVEHSYQSIIAEIRSAARGSLARQAEKPPRIAGKLRGSTGAGAAAPPELFRTALEITTNGRYLKTITIIHD